MGGEKVVPHQGNSRVLVIKPGSTATRFGVFTCEGPEWVSSVHHGDEDLEQFRGRSMLARTGYRAALIEKALVAAGYDAKQFAAVRSREGPLPRWIAVHTSLMMRLSRNCSSRDAASMPVISEPS